MNKDWTGNAKSIGTNIEIAIAKEYGMHVKIIGECDECG